MSASSLPSIPRPSILWKHLSADRRRQAAEAFWSDTALTAEHGEAIGAIAKQLKFRPKSVAVLPVARKAQYLLALPGIPESLALRLLIYYHIAHQRPMMAAFLDALGIGHDNGLIADETVVPPEADKVRAAVQTIAGAYPGTDVALYLSTLSWQDTETWALLPTLPETKLQAPA
jgi:hypothetical protein